MTDQTTDRAADAPAKTSAINSVLSWLKDNWDEPTGVGKAKLAAIVVLLFLFFALFNRDDTVEPVVDVVTEQAATATKTPTEGVATTPETPLETASALGGLRDAGAGLIADTKSSAAAAVEGVKDATAEMADSVQQATGAAIASTKEKTAAAVEGVKTATGAAYQATKEEVAELTTAAKAKTAAVVAALQAPSEQQPATDTTAAVAAPAVAAKQVEAAREELAELAVAAEEAPGAVTAFVTEPVLPSASSKTTVTTEQAATPEILSAPAAKAVVAQSSPAPVVDATAGLQATIQGLQAKEAELEQALIASRKQVADLQQQLAAAKAAQSTPSIEQELKAQVDSLKQQLNDLLDGLKSEIDKHSGKRDQPSRTKL